MSDITIAMSDEVDSQFDLCPLTTQQGCIVFTPTMIADEIRRFLIKNIFNSLVICLLYRIESAHRNYAGNKLI